MGAQVKAVCWQKQTLVRISLFIKLSMASRISMYIAYVLTTAADDSMQSTLGGAMSSNHAEPSRANISQSVQMAEEWGNSTDRMLDKEHNASAVSDHAPGLLRGV